jgi:uncharacterized lipoprotein NlpE involved in copper resistance
MVMKKIFAVLAVILLLTIMACSKSDDVSSKDIGPEGETLVSSDGNATLNVPVGALEKVPQLLLLRLLLIYHKGI